MSGTSTLAGSMAPKLQADISTYTGRLAKRLTMLREESGLSVKKFAAAVKKAGYSVEAPTVYSWEQGRSSPHIEALPAIAKVLKVSIGDILPSK